MLNRQGGDDSSKQRKEASSKKSSRDLNGMHKTTKNLTNFKCQIINMMNLSIIFVALYSEGDNDRVGPKKKVSRKKSGQDSTGNSGNTVDFTNV